MGEQRGKKEEREDKEGEMLLSDPALQTPLGLVGAGSRVSHHLPFSQLYP